MAGWEMGAALGAAARWTARRAMEPSTWAGLAMIAIALGSDPMQANGFAQAMSLILGGGLVATPGGAPRPGRPE